MKSDKPDSIGDRSVWIGGNAAQNVIVTGDHTTARVSYEPVSLPSADEVQITDVLEEILETLNSVESVAHLQIEREMVAAQQEAAKSHPHRDAIGESLENALKMAKLADRFPDIAIKLKPHVISATAWLGSNWHRLLHLVGLTPVGSGTGAVVRRIALVCIQGFPLRARLE